MRFSWEGRSLPLATVALAIAFLVFPFAGLLGSDQSLFVERDLLRSFLPAKYFWLRALRAEGAIPAWNPYLFSGAPYWADLKSGALNPFHLALLPFSPERIHYAFSWFLFSHFPVMALGMFLFLRRIGAELGPAAIFALAYSLSGVVISSLCMPNLLAGQAVLPFFAALLVSRLSSAPRALGRNEVGSMICLAVPVYAATPEFSYFFALALVLAWLARPSVAGLFSLASVGAGSFLLSAAALLPALEALVHTTRYAKGVTPEEANNFVFDPQRLREIFLSLPFGNYGPKAVHWGGRYASTFLYSPYLGAGLPMALAGFFYRARESKASAALFGLLALLFLALSFGSHLPVDVYGFFFRYFPGWSLFRYPEKMLIPLSFLLITAQAIGWRALMQETEARNEKPLWWAAGAFLACAVALYLSVAFFPTDEQRQLGLASLRHYYFCGGAMLVLLVALKLQPALWPFRWLLLLLVMGIDLGSHARALTWHQPLRVIRSTAGEKIQTSLRARAPELERGAAFRFTSLLVAEKRNFLRSPPGEEVDMVGQMAQSVAHHLVPAVPMLLGIHDVYGTGLLQNTERMSLWRALSEAQPQRFLNLLGAYYVAQLEGPYPGELSIKVNEAALPFLFVPAEVRMVSSREEGRALLLGEGFPERKQLLLETEAPGRAANFAGSVRLLERSSGRIKVEVSGKKAGQAGVVAIGESHDRHWRAKVDGEERPVLLANGWSMAVEMGKACEPACTLELRYANPWIPAGLALTALWVLVIAGASLLPLLRGRHPAS